MKRFNVTIEKKFDNLKAPNREQAKEDILRYIRREGITREDIEVEEIEEDEKAKVTFHPQAWQNDYAIPVDPEGKIEFTVPLSDATDEDGNLLEDDSYESDSLQVHEDAPRWIREWEGPFYIRIERL